MNRSPFIIVIGVLAALLMLWLLASIKTANNKMCRQQWNASVDCAMVSMQDGDYAAAIRQLDASLVSAKKCNDDLLIGSSLSNLAFAYGQLNDRQKEEALYRQSLKPLSRLKGKKGRLYAQALADLARICAMNEQYKEGEAFAKHSIEVYVDACGPTSEHTASGIEALACVYAHQDRYREAESLYKKAAVIHRKNGHSSDLDMATNLNGLANLYCSMGDYHKARDMFQQELSIRENEMGPQEPRLAACFDDCACVEHKLGQYEKAVQLSERAISIAEPALGCDNTAVIDYTLTNIRASVKLEEYAYAEPRIKCLLSTLEKKHYQNATRKLELLIYHETALRKLGRSDEAQLALEMVIEAQRTKGK